MISVSEGKLAGQQARQRLSEKAEKAIDMGFADRESTRRLLCTAFLALVLLTGCKADAPAGLPATTPSPTASFATSELGGFSMQEVMTLASLYKVDEFPLYEMHFYGPYNLAAPLEVFDVQPDDRVGSGCRAVWACSLFASLGDEANMLFGRNFDWDESPALILFTHPASGYATVSMVDIAYLGYGGPDAGRLMELALDERSALLQAPLLPFDGMNERGLTIGMAAVPAWNMVPDADKETTGSLRVMRMILDQAADVEEAIAILDSHNIDIHGGPPLHYLIADATGRSVLVEFSAGEMVVLPNSDPWQPATNFLLAEAGGSTDGLCWRYDLLLERLGESAGELTTGEAMVLLQDVSQPNTQWSVVYGISTGDILVSMGRQFSEVHSFHLAVSRAWDLE